MATTLNQLAVRYFSQRAAFEAQLQAPVLVWEAPARAGDPGAQDELDEGSWASTTAGGPMSRPRAGETLVFSVEKVNAKANAFAMGITVGRVDTNDVVVDDASVSRFHAYLQFDARKKTWSLTDADSKNGTFVGADRLSSSAHVALPDGATVRFGDITMRFFLPAAFLRWLDEKASPRKAP